MEDCKPCPFGHTSRPGARTREECEPIPQPCPVGQVALLGAVSPAQCVCLPGEFAAVLTPYTSIPTRQTPCLVLGPCSWPQACT
jgi:hypothetical protein